MFFLLKKTQKACLFFFKVAIDLFDFRWPGRCCCRGFSPVAVSGGSSPAVVCGLLTVVVALVAEPWLWSEGFSRCRTANTHSYLGRALTLSNSWEAAVCRQAANCRDTCSVILFVQICAQVYSLPSSRSQEKWKLHCESIKRKVPEINSWSLLNFAPSEQCWWDCSSQLWPLGHELSLSCLSVTEVVRLRAQGLCLPTIVLLKMTPQPQGSDADSLDMPQGSHTGFL